MLYQILNHPIQAAPDAERRDWLRPGDTLEIGQARLTFYVNRVDGEATPQLVLYRGPVPIVDVANVAIWPVAPWIHLSTRPWEDADLRALALEIDCHGEPRRVRIQAVRRSIQIGWVVA